MMARRKALKILLICIFCGMNSILFIGCNSNSSEDTSFYDGTAEYSDEETALDTDTYDTLNDEDATESNMSSDEGLGDDTVSSGEASEVDEVSEADRELTDEEKEEFYTSEIDDELFQRMKGKSYKDDCTVSLDELRYVHILYIDFNGQTQSGEIVCNRAIAEDLIEIFEELYINNYELEEVSLVDKYDADDETSMANDNSSCFNYRCISYTNTVSKHGLGLAIDINPLYNPYVKTVDGRTSVEPANAIAYVDRSQDFEHKIDENDLAYKLFISHGFTWGGSWKNSKDYQHFEYDL